MWRTHYPFGVSKSVGVAPHEVIAAIRRMRVEVAIV